MTLARRCLGGGALEAVHVWVRVVQVHVCSHAIESSCFLSTPPVTGRTAWNDTRTPRGVCPWITIKDTTDGAQVS